MLAWPNLQDYNEAIQSPKLCFKDEELQGGTVETTHLGLPKAITGGFASVYKVKCQHKNWAVRCFLKEFADQRARYQSIAEHLASAKLPYTVDFEFLPEGIRVHGRWFPILKMEWVQGELLNNYIQKHLGQPAVFQLLATKWTKMLAALRAHGISHGDLQHGNILVINDELRLIDYDGMFVPALEGKASNELGHRNYQHPQRTEHDFDASIDSFSAWVIYVSLIALSIDPSVWTQLKAGDESLLFHRSDFEEPFGSPVFTHLSQHSDQRLGALATLFQSIVLRSPNQVPALDDQLAVQSVSMPTSVVSKLVETTSRPAWLYGEAAVKQSSPGSTKVYQVGDPTWVLEWMFPATAEVTKEFSLETTNGRRVAVAASLIGITVVSVALAVSIFAGVSLVILLVTTSILGSTAIAAHVSLRQLYRRDPIVIQREELLARKKGEDRTAQELRTVISDIEHRKESVRLRQKRRQEEHENARLKVERQEQRERDGVMSKLRVALNAVNKSRALLTQEEASAMTAVRNRVGLEIAKLTQQIDGLIKSETDEKTQTLSKQQSYALRNYLSRCSIDDYRIPLIGEKLKARLRGAGIRTAMDVDFMAVRRVDGIGDMKTQSLEAWRRNMELRAPIPHSLTAQEISDIKLKYEKSRQALEAERSRSQQKMDGALVPIRATYGEKKESLNKLQASTQSESNEKISQIAEQYAKQYKWLTERYGRTMIEAQDLWLRLDTELMSFRKQMAEHQWKLAKSQRELIMYRNVSFQQYLRRLVGVNI